MEAPLLLYSLSVLRQISKAFFLFFRFPLHPASSPASQGSCYTRAPLLKLFGTTTSHMIAWDKLQRCQVHLLRPRFSYSNGIGLKGMNTVVSPMARVPTYALPLFLPNTSVSHLWWCQLVTPISVTLLIKTEYLAKATSRKRMYIVTVGRHIIHSIWEVW